ncbi:MAG: sugar 3,4-ketoisomerase [Chitinophagaceae bacterium]
MATLVTLPKFSDERGSLVVLDNISELLPFEVKRIFYILADDNAIRGGHRHKLTKQAAICIKGQCSIFNDNNEVEQEFILDSPEKCLILETFDWHLMHSFSKDAILLILASSSFDAGDYIYDAYKKVEYATL